MSEIKTNKISSLASNNNITIDPDGTGNTIVASGKVGIATSSPAHNLDVTQTGSTSARIGATGSSGDNDGTVIINNGGSGDAMLRFDYEGNTDRARIGVSSSGQQLEFYTAGNNERMRIKSDGEINIGGEEYTDAHLNVRDNGGGNNGWQGAAVTVYGSFGGKLSFVDNNQLASSTPGYSLYTADNGNDFYVQGNTNSTTNSGGVYLNNRATSWSSASDERQKENLVDITGALEDVASLRTVKGNYIWSPNETKAFLIAQDVQTILPEAVSVQNKNDDAEDQRLGLDYNQIIPLLVAALKESKSKIEQLEARIAALEAE